MNPIVLIVPLILFVGGLYARWWASQRHRAAGQQHPEWKAGSIASRLGLAVVEGDPEFNVVYNDRGEQFGQANAFHNPVPELRIRIAGMLYDRPAEIAYRDRIDTSGAGFGGGTITQTIFCRIAVAVRTGFPPFEITLRTPTPYLEPRPRMLLLPETSLGDAMLDQQFLLRCADPRVGPAIAPQLGPIRANTYVHITGDEGMVAFELSHTAGLMMLAQADAIAFVLASIASVMEGSPVPGAMVMPSPTSGMTSVPASQLFGEEQLPVPCTRCGAPMQDASPPGALAGSTMSCPYCRSVEQLPTDAATRANALRTRVAQLRWASAAIEGPERAFAEIVERFKSAPMVVMFGAIALIMAFSFANGAAESIRSARSPFDAIWVFLMPAVITGMVVAYVRMFRRYKTLVRPQLSARAPLEPGRPMRCRHCGGNLPAGPGPFVPCGYCHTQNLVTPDVASERATRLDAEVREYQARAANVQTAMLQTVDPNAFNRTMFVTAGVVMALVVALAMAATVVIKIVG